MRRALLVALVLPLLVACGSGTPDAIKPGPQQIDVSNPQLVSFKKHTTIPDCPRVASAGVKGGMPGVTLPCLGGGRSVDVAGLRGPTIVNFWASWCGDCRKEMPALAAYAKHQSAVRVLGIDFLDPQPGAALELAKGSDVGYPLVADTKGALDKASPMPHISGLPLTVFLDAQGSIVHIEAGAMLTEKDVAEAAQKYLGATG
jgi:thiol-disulfide isomerase/thioredoxin